MPTGNLPSAGRKLFEGVYNKALKGSCQGDKGCAAASAWSVVKKKYKKVDGKWIKKSDALAEMSMFITKATLDGKIMRWAAVNSDTDPDSYQERMSLELYEDFIGHINNKDVVPEQFQSFACSSYWCGGMPYLSVSHYPDLNGQAVPGEPSLVLVDGNKLKAKGVLYNTPLGHSVFRSLQEDKNKSPEDKIRISIGFLDLAHKHGDNGQVWVRENATSICPECLSGVGEKVYVKGYLVHLALTRVPVNKRTEMVLEEKSMAAKKITRKEDAASIVGESLATEIDTKNKAQALKSDALVEMSEGEEPTAEETQELIEEAETDVENTSIELENKSDMPEEDMKKKCMKDGKVDEECMKKMREKSNSEPVVEDMMDASMLPYGGATSMKEAQKAKEAVEEMSHVMDMWGMFSNVAWNIIDRSDIPDKKAAFVKALDEFKSMLAAKAMLEFSQATPPAVEKSTNENPDHELKPALDALLSAVDNSVVLEGDVAAKLQSINPSLQELGTAISDYVTHKSVAKETPAQNKDNDNLLDKITELIQPLSQSVQELKNQLGVLEAKSNAQNVRPPNRIPQPRSVQIVPNLAQTTEPKVKPGSIRDIINKSVGITE